MDFLFLLAGLIIGALIMWLFRKSASDPRVPELERNLTESERQKSVLEERIRQAEASAKTATDLLNEERRRVIELSTKIATLQAESKNYLDRLENQKSELENLHQRFKAEFENLSAAILEEKSKKFTEQNRANLDIILNPLKEKLKDFEQKVEQSYKIESAERNTLKGEIKNLIDLNRQISEEANNLAKALKGDTKKQGNWGEVILERILERSGLIKGSEYELQFSTTNEEGRRIQPDVIINLPDNKHLIVDSKVSLVAYEAMVNAANEEDREKALKEHIASVRNHIKNLSEKNYQTSADFKTPDFVLLFMPIESSFGIAIQADNELFGYAWDKKIVIVSPSTLLATLRTIASVWKQEKQTRNAIEIARQGGALYDKFKSFMDDMLDVGTKMGAARKSYEEAMQKLSSGNGNIVKRIEDLKKLGAKATKDLPQGLIERAEEHLEGSEK